MDKYTIVALLEWGVLIAMTIGLVVVSAMVK